MVSTSLEIANMALSKIGSRAITSFTQSGSNEATAINAVYDTILDEVLSEHPWTFAQRRIALTATVPDDVSLTIDDAQNTPIVITGATAADPVVITATAHGFSDDDWVKITSVVGMTELNGNFYIVSNATANTFELTDTDGDDVDGLLYTAYTSGGQIQKCFEMPTLDSQSVVVYEKPDDYLKIIGKSVKEAFIAVELDKIISDTTGLKIVYTYRNTTVSQYFPKFIQALVTRLAAEVAFTIINSVSKSKELKELYETVDLPDAVSVDSTQGTPTPAMQDEWLDARVIGSGGYVTTGETWHSA